VYGVAADPRQRGAERRLYAAKGRDRHKPVALLAADLATVEACGARLRAAERRLAEAFWPGPLTLVLRTPRGREGFRVPAHVWALRVLRQVGGVLRVSSANRSGQPPALTAEQAARALGARVAAVMDAGRARVGTPSTVVQVHGREIRVLREGAIPAPDILRCAARAGAARGKRRGNAR
jgi:tRNA threonylcarbamoyl adenosine modification protein (Sua5/YciO/YrdC/YwlC family)